VGNFVTQIVKLTLMCCVFICCQHVKVVGLQQGKGECVSVVLHSLASQLMCDTVADE